MENDNPVSDKWHIDIEFVEYGDIYFFYKPKREVEKVEGIDSVSRFYFVLDPEPADSPARYIIL